MMQRKVRKFRRPNKILTPRKSQKTIDNRQKTTDKRQRILNGKGRLLQSESTLSYTASKKILSDVGRGDFYGIDEVSIGIIIIVVECNAIFHELHIFGVWVCFKKVYYSLFCFINGTGRRLGYRHGVMITINERVVVAVVAYCA